MNDNQTGGSWARTAEPTAANHLDLSLDELADYFAAASAGMIGATRDVLCFAPDRFNPEPLVAPELLRFQVDGERGTVSAVNSKNRRWHNSLFQLDLDRALSAANAHDLMEVKQSFYSRLPRDLRGRPLRPYCFLREWGSLFHPQFREYAGAPERITRDLSPLAGEERARTASPYFQREFQEQLDRLSDTELTYGNEMSFLWNGAAFDAKLQLVRAARRYVYADVMAVIGDDSSQPLIEELARKARQGVDVRLIQEAFYWPINRKCTNELQRAGVEVVYANEWLQHTCFHHNKFWIADGERAIVGGQNVLAAQNLSDGFNHGNRDTDLLIERGPAVTDLEHAFLRAGARLPERDWSGRRRRSCASIREAVQQKKAAQRAAGVRGAASYERWFASPETRMNGICRVVAQVPYDRVRIIDLYQRYAAAARRSVFITTAELFLSTEEQPNLRRAPMDELFSILKHGAVQHGLKLHLICNGLDGGDGEVTASLIKLGESLAEQGKPWQARVVNRLLEWEAAQRVAPFQAAMRSIVRMHPLLRTYEHANYMHAKQALFDRVLVGVGSYNIDYWSSVKNHETQLFCLDRGLAEQLERQLLVDLANSVPVLDTR